MPDMFRFEARVERIKGQPGEQYIGWKNNEDHDGEIFSVFLP